MINSQSFIIINNDECLKKYCHLAQQKETVILDTEFVRVHTYSPQLGLIQMFDGEYLCLIDPLTIQDFAPFISLLKNQRVEKVLHGSSEDLRIFKELFNQLPNPLWDTQVMAKFLNLGMSAGLKRLLEDFLNIHLEKTETRTNWLKRPLSQKQLDYAALDVKYLLPLFQILKDLLQKTPWFEACIEECDLLKANINQTNDPLSNFLNLKIIKNFSPIQLSRLKELVEWREKEAKKRNLAVNFVIKKEIILSLAKKGAKNISDLIELGLRPHEIRYYGKVILRVIDKAKNNKTIPILSLEFTKAGYKNDFNRCKSFLENIIPENIPSELLLAKKYIHEFLVWFYSSDKKKQKPLLLKGWRAFYGEQLVRQLS